MMHYWRIVLILIALLATAVNAATNIAPAPRRPRCQTKMVQSGSVLLLWLHQKVLGGGANSPQCNLLCATKIAVGHGGMLSGHITISRPHPALKPQEQMVHTINELIVWFQGWTGSVDGTGFDGGSAKTVAGSYMRVMMGDLLVWALKNWTKTSSKIPLGSRHQEPLIGIIIM